LNGFHSLTIGDVRHDTRDALIVTFDLPQELAPAFSFTHGQYLTLRVHIDGEDVRRAYSICSAVQDAHLQVAIKRVPGGVFSSWASEHLKPGRSVEVMPPRGAFHVPLDPARGRHYLAIAAGSGITPIFSIIKTTLITEPQSRFTLIYGNRASSSVILKESLADLKDRFIDRFSLIHVMSREHQDIDLLNGRIDRHKCEAILRQWMDPSHIDVAFLCGPTQMMDEALAALHALKFPKERIKTELFAASPQVRRKVVPVQAGERGEQCDIAVVIDGRRRQFTMERNKEPILDAALRQGIELPYSCKGGVCSTCRCKLVEGEVDMDANFALEDYEVAQGFVLACQSYPMTDRVTLDFEHIS
jgi:ring-1,2-phenylacetyl-CoA epoxidase subunit PaaE